MREIKFRAWNKQSKKMVYYDKDCSSPDITLNGVLLHHSTHTNLSYMYELMQFTGYKYKSLRDAYEGDIFDAHPDGSRRFLRTIIWNDELARFQAPYSDGSGIQLFTKQECLLYEYVGNIHQNPKLLEQNNGS